LKWTKNMDEKRIYWGLSNKGGQLNAYWCVRGLGLREKHIDSLSKFHRSPNTSLQ